MKKKFYLSLLFMLGAFLLPIGVNASSGDVACKIGTNEFSDITIAINTAQNGDEIILEKDVSTKVEIPADKKITININGKMITSIVENNGSLTIKNGNITNMKNLESAFLIMDEIACSTSSCLRNSGTATVKNSIFSYQSSISSTGATLYNEKSGTLTIESGTYKSQKQVTFYNHGNMIINGGSFELNDINLGNKNTKTLTINGGVFKNSNGMCLENNSADLIINDGTFTCNTVAENYLLSENSNITVNGGTFNTTDTAFSNTMTSKNSTILLNGGKINMTGTDYVISDDGTNNTIQIIQTNIDAFKSKGLFSDNTFIIGKDDGTVKKDIPLINIPNGIMQITGTFKFYDGTINLREKMNQNKIITPQNYYVSYDTNTDKTLNAYLKDKSQIVTTVTVEDKNHEKVENPKTGDSNIIYLSILAIFMILGIGISSKKILKNK